MLANQRTDRLHRGRVRVSHAAVRAEVHRREVRAGLSAGTGAEAVSATRERHDSAMPPRARFALLLAITIVLGLASRAVRVGWSVWDKSLGDVLYTVAAYLVLAIALPRARPVSLAAAAFGFSLAIELFQITGIPWALGRDRAWVRLLLGTTFAWHDVACYALGAVAIAIIAARVVPARMGER